MMAMDGGKFLSCDSVEHMEEYDDEEMDHHEAGDMMDDEYGDEGEHMDDYGEQMVSGRY